MPKRKQLTALVGDRPGTLGDVATALGEKTVDLIAFMAVEDGNAIRVIVDKPGTAKKIFEQRGWQTVEEEIVEVTVPDRPGSLGAIAGRIGDAGINIRYAYAGSARSAAKINFYFAVDDVKAALKALR